MLEERKVREQFSIASSLEEAKEFAEIIGYPVLLLPFGVPDIPCVLYKAGRTAQGPEELAKHIEEMQGRRVGKPLFGFIHVQKSQRKWK